MIQFAIWTRQRNVEVYIKESRRKTRKQWEREKRMGRKKKDIQGERMGKSDAGPPRCPAPHCRKMDQFLVGPSGLISWLSIHSAMTAFTWSTSTLCPCGRIQHVHVLSSQQWHATKSCLWSSAGTSSLLGCFIQTQFPIIPFLFSLLGKHKARMNTKCTT